MLWGMKFRWVTGVVLGTLLTLALSSRAAAQVALGDLHATANGQLSSVYAGTFGNLGVERTLPGLCGHGHDHRRLLQSKLPLFQSASLLRALAGQFRFAINHRRQRITRELSIFLGAATFRGL